MIALFTTASARRLFYFFTAGGACSGKIILLYKSDIKKA